MTDQDINQPRSLVQWHVALRLRSVLARRNMTQRQLASATGIPQPTLATYLAGRVAMPITALSAICEATGVDPGWLLFGLDRRLDASALALALLRAFKGGAFAGDLMDDAVIKDGTARLAEAYGWACNLIWTGSEDPQAGITTVTFDRDALDPPSD